MDTNEPFEELADNLHEIFRRKKMDVRPTDPTLRSAIALEQTSVAMERIARVLEDMLELQKRHHALLQAMQKKRWSE